MPETTLYVRVKQALTWLKRDKGILQKDVADKMGMAEASFTRALMRIKEKNDESFVIAFHSATNNRFSLDYLLNGRGTLLAQEVEQPEQPTEPMPVWADAMIDIMAKQIKENETLHRELRQSITEFQAARADLEKLLYRLKYTDSIGDSTNPYTNHTDGSLAADVSPSEK